MKTSAIMINACDNKILSSLKIHDIIDIYLTDADKLYVTLQF